MLKTNLRIISLVPSLTELLVDLGLEENIVGITKFCVHPSNLRKDKTIVGGTKNIHLDKIEALNPTYIICNKEENTKQIVEDCSKIATTHVSEIYTIADIIDLTRHYGKIFSCEKQAESSIKELEAKITDFTNFVKDKALLNVVYFIWKKPWMVAANNTFIHYLLELTKFRNCYEDLSRYPEISLEDLDSKNIDAIFLSSEPYPFKEKNAVDFAANAKDSKVVLVNGEYFSWYGTRLLKAFDYFKQLRAEL